MKNNNSSSLSIKDLIANAVKEGIVQKDLQSQRSSKWFRAFHYEKDPIHSFDIKKSLTDELIPLFINRKAETKVISSYFGESKNLPYNFHLAIIGSKGCGKHTTLKIITEVIIEKFPDIKVGFYSLEESYDYIRNIILSESELKALDERVLDVRIISCTGKNRWLFIKRIKDFKNNSKLTISIWNTRNFLFHDNIFANKEIYFNNYSRNDIVGIFKKRIDKFLKDSEDYSNIINNILLPKVSEAFQGNLYISFLFFREIHLRAILMNKNDNLPQLIDPLLQQYLNIKNQKITTKEQEIIHYYLNLENRIFITTSDLKEEMQLDRTSAWKYLENLTKKKVFKKISYGNPSRYQINEVFISFYEDKLREELIFKKK